MAGRDVTFSLGGLPAWQQVTVEFIDPLGRPEQWITENDVSIVGAGGVPVTTSTVYTDASGNVTWVRVGAKVALAILGVLAPDDLATAIALGDKVALARAPGVGKRLAERLVVELKQAAGELALPAALAGSGGVQVAAGSSDPALSAAVSALVNLGYGQSDAARAVAAAASTVGDADVGPLVKAALKELSR